MTNINKPLLITVCIIAIIVIIVLYFYFNKKKEVVNAEAIVQAKKNLPETVKRLNEEIAELDICRKSILSDSGDVGAASGRSGVENVTRKISSLGDCYKKHPELYVMLVQGDSYTMSQEDGVKTADRFNAAIKAKKDLLEVIQK